MSRIGKLPVEIPSGVEVKVEGGWVKVKGPKGSLEQRIGAGVSVAVEDGNVVVSPESTGKQARANFGTMRSLIENMVIGVTEGYKKELELSGVGYTCSLSGNKLTLTVGYSHDVTMEIPQAISCKVQKTSIELESIDKQLLGLVAAKIRDVHPPEPYLGKGIRYAGEQVRRKAGKTGK